MADNKNICDREKVVREIEKRPSRSVKNISFEDRQHRRRYATKSHFKPIIEPLQKIVDNSSTRAIKDEPHDDDDDDVKTLSVIQKREEDAKSNKRKRSNISLDRKSKRLDAPRLDA